MQYLQGRLAQSLRQGLEFDRWDLVGLTFTQTGNNSKTHPGGVGQLLIAG